jgi:gliding motility-associated-like protein
VISIEQIPLPETLLGIGEHEIQISVADSNNNVATCAFTVTVLDSIAPVIACSASTQDVFEACLTSVPDLSSQLLVTECTSYTIDQNPLPGTVITPGSATIIFTVTDEFGLSATCSTEYSFESTIGLEIACDLPQDISVSSCTFDLPDYTSDIEVLSSCGEVVFTQIPAPGTVISSSVVEVTITAVDANGNTAFCGSSINFFYFSDIVMECPADVEIQLDESCSAIADFPLPLLSGGCGEVILTQTGGPNVGEQLTAGVYTISFEAHDGFGNSSSCSFALNVIDAIAPDIICGPNVVSCIPNVVPEWPTATDNCGEVTITLSPDVVWSQGTAFPQGLTQLIFVAEDNFGNTSQCITNIQINQPVAPNWFVNEHLCIEDEDIDLNSLLPSNGEFSWEGNVIDDHILSPATLGEGAYSITLVSQNGICLLDSTLNFTVGSRPEVSVGEDITVCGLVADGEGESTSTDVQWTSVPGTDILGVYTLTPTLQADTYGTYNFSMYAFGTFGCFASDTLAVTFVEPPVPILTSVESLNMLSGQTIEIPYSNPGTGEVVVMTGSETGITVVREPSVLEVTGNIPGEYIIEMYTVNIPCPAEQVNLKVNVVELEIPTGFSPNGDGVNDFYEINAIELFPLLQLRVFDRDGNLMYYAPSYDNTWDGTSIRGNELPAGTYFLVATTAEGRTIESYLIIRRS